LCVGGNGTIVWLYMHEHIRNDVANRIIQ